MKKSKFSESQIIKARKENESGRKADDIESIVTCVYIMQLPSLFMFKTSS